MSGCEYAGRVTASGNPNTKCYIWVGSLVGAFFSRGVILWGPTSRAERALGTPRHCNFLCPAGSEPEGDEDKSGAALCVPGRQAMEDATGESQVCTVPNAGGEGYCPAAGGGPQCVRCSVLGGGVLSGGWKRSPVCMGLSAGVGVGAILTVEISCGPHGGRSGVFGVQAELMHFVTGYKCEW